MKSKFLLYFLYNVTSKLRDVQHALLLRRYACKVHYFKKTVQREGYWPNGVKNIFKKKTLYSYLIFFEIGFFFYTIFLFLAQFAI